MTQSLTKMTKICLASSFLKSSGSWREMEDIYCYDCNLRRECFSFWRTVFSRTGQICFPRTINDSKWISRRVFRKALALFARDRKIKTSLYCCSWNCHKLIIFWRSLILILRFFGQIVIQIIWIIIDNVVDVLMPSDVES